MRYLILLTLLISSQAFSMGCYLDGGVMIHNSGDSWQEVDYKDSGEPVAQEIINPIGTVEFGCTYKRLTAFAYHSTSVQMQDTGINGVGFKIRVWSWGN